MPFIRKKRLSSLLKRDFALIEPIDINKGANMWAKMVFAMNIYELRRDGVLKFQGSKDDCYMKLQQLQSQSFEWAMKYEGWTINSIEEDWRDHYHFYHEDVG